MLTRAELAELEAAAGDAPPAALAVFIAKMHRRVRTPITLRDAGGHFVIGREGHPGGLLHGTTELKAVHAAIAHPHALVHLPDMPLTTARSRIKALVKRLDERCPGTAELLMPAKSRDGGLSVLPGPTLVFAPRVPGAIVATDGTLKSIV